MTCTRGREISPAFSRVARRFSLTFIGVCNSQDFPLPLTNVHSHNDYEQTAPLYSALHQGKHLQVIGANLCEHYLLGCTPQLEGSLGQSQTMSNPLWFT